MSELLRLGTRGSLLAQTQSQQVADAITAQTGAVVELITISTRGDQVTDTPLPEIGGKGLFTAELETALLAGSIDIAVHSLKDLPTDDPEGLMLGAIPVRVDPRDCLVGPGLDTLAHGAVVGSGSLRRRTQLLALRPDLEIRDIRGNVPTRIRKRDEGHYAATVLAMAGLVRLGVERADIRPFALDEMIPAVGQGALAVQCRTGDARVLGLLAAIDDAQTRRCVNAERVFLRAFGGGCNVPAGAHARVEGDTLRLIACMANAEGEIRRFTGTGDDGSALGEAAAAALAR